MVLQAVFFNAEYAWLEGGRGMTTGKKNLIIKMQQNPK
jgi:hypothetical protein